MHLEEAKKYYAIVDKIRILFSVLADVLSLLLAPASGGQHVNINPVPQLPTPVLFIFTLIPISTPLANMTLRSFLAGVRESIEQGVDSINKWTRDPRQVKLQERLQHIFKNLVIYAPEGFIQHASVPHLEVLPFDPENPSSPALHFFLPWSTSRLAQHQTNFVLNDTGERIESTTEIMSILNDSAVREGRPHDMEEFDWLVKRLIWEVETYPRHGTKDDAEPLRVITKWKISKLVLSVFVFSLWTFSLSTSPEANIHVVVDSTFTPVLRCLASRATRESCGKPTSLGLSHQKFRMSRLSWPISHVLTQTGCSRLS